MLAPSASDVLRVFNAKGYRVDAFNLFGVRAADLQSNAFNDIVGVLFTMDLDWHVRTWPATTDPGVYYREHPMNVNGTAILLPGRHAKAFKLGAHAGYPALQQNAPLMVWRDANRNATLEPGGKVETGMFGINMHRANPATLSKRVDRWSAGCQVIASPADFGELLHMATRHGGPFDYTLFEERDFA